MNVEMQAPWLFSPLFLLNKNRVFAFDLGPFSLNSTITK